MRSAGQVDHPGEFLRAPTAPITVVPDVFVHAQDLHVLEPGWVVRSLDQDRLDLGPERIPGSGERSVQALDRRSLVAEQSDRPPDRHGAQQAQRCADPGVLLEEQDHRTGALPADPAALTAPDPHWPSRPGASFIIRHAFLLPDMVVTSDAIPFTTADDRIVEGDGLIPDEAVTHPRSTGTLSCFLRTLVRETVALTLIEALRRCSLLPAQFFGKASSDMDREGQVQHDCDAGLIILDPDVVSDRPTYKAPGHSSTGMVHVIVGGEFVVFGNAMIPTALPGRTVVDSRK